MLAAPLPRLNISCTCTECSTFLISYPRNPKSFPLSSGPGFSLPSNLPPTRKQLPNPQSTPRLRPTAPTLEPSPSFLLTRSSPRTKLTPSPPRINVRAALPSIALSPTWNLPGDFLKRATFASRSLWVHISSPIDETKTPISAKTPGLAFCSNAGCERKVVPGFGHAVCEGCEDELRGAVLGLAVVMEDEKLKGVASARPAPSRVDSCIAVSPEWNAKEDVESGDGDDEGAGPALFAVPTTPPSTLLFLTHSRNASLQSTPQRAAEVVAVPGLFALPGTFLETKPCEEVTPTTSAITTTTKYAMDFPALPTSMPASEAESENGSKRNSGEIKVRSLLTEEETARSSPRNSNGSVKWKIR